MVYICGLLKPCNSQFPSIVCDLFDERVLSIELKAEILSLTSWLFKSDDNKTRLEATLKEEMKWMYMVFTKKKKKRIRRHHLEDFMLGSFLALFWTLYKSKEDIVEEADCRYWVHAAVNTQQRE